MRVVLDSNIIVSGLLYQGNESRVLQLGSEKYFEMFLSELILSEVARALRNKFRANQEDIAEAGSLLRDSATIIDPPPIVSDLTGNPPDDHVLDLVLASEADFLVTGDRRHLLPLGRYGTARIVASRQFLEEIAAEQS